MSIPDSGIWPTQAGKESLGTKDDLVSSQSLTVVVWAHEVSCPCAVLGRAMFGLPGRDGVSCLAGSSFGLE